MKIELLAIDSQGDITWDREFDTLKEARAWVKNWGLSKEYWERSSESEGWAERNITTLQLHKNGECIQDWFPKF